MKGVAVRNPSIRIATLTLLLATAWSAPVAAKADLDALSLEDLLNLTITGASKYEQRQQEVGAAVSVISRNEIRAFGWRSLAEALNSLPGVHLTYDRQYTYFGTRGFGLPGDYNTRVLLAINGNRLNDGVYDAALIGREFLLDVDLIERIEFIPGPGGAVYGQNALFGVVNIITRNGAGVNGLELAASYEHPQALREGRVTWGKQLDNGLDVLLSAKGMRARGEDLFMTFPGGTPDAGIATRMDGERDEEFYAQLARGAWSLNFAYGDRRKDDPTGSYFGDPLMAGQYQRDRTMLGQLQYQDSFAGDTLHLLARLFMGQERYSGLFSYGGIPYLATGPSDWHGVEARVLSTAWAGHKLMAGFEYQDITRSDQTNINTTDSTDPANVRIVGKGWRMGVYVQDEWALTSQLSTTLGLRADRNSVTGTALSPRAALIWSATPETTLKALYGRAHRAPNAFERDFADNLTQVANPGLNGETIDTLELVADHRLRRDLQLRASLYRWKMEGLVTLGIDPVSGLGQYQSGEQVNATGLELSALKTWDWGGRLRASLSHQDLSYESGGRLNNSPRLLGKLNFSGPLANTGLLLGYELQYDSQRQSVAGNKIDGYWLSNLHLVADKWAKGLEVSLGLYNLFDTRYEHPAALNTINWQNALVQDGRSVRLKMTYQF
jgi:outer membrane receptor protein involved in Fe transport